MATQRGVFSQREEQRAVGLAARQPESSEELTRLLDEGRSRLGRSVLEDADVAKRLKGVRHRIVGFDLVEEKARNGRSLRLVDVGIYDYDKDALLVVTTELPSGRVRGIEERKGWQPPLTDAELAEAAGLLRRYLAESRKAPSRSSPVAVHAREAFDDRHAAFGHRAFWVTLWSGGKRARPIVARLVDLSTGRVFDDEPPDWLMNG